MNNDTTALFQRGGNSDKDSLNTEVISISYQNDLCQLIIHYKFCSS